MASKTSSDCLMWPLITISSVRSLPSSTRPLLWKFSHSTVPVTSMSPVAPLSVILTSVLEPSRISSVGCAAAPALTISNTAPSVPLAGSTKRTFASLFCPAVMVTEASLSPPEMTETEAAPPDWIVTPSPASVEPSVMRSVGRCPTAESPSL